MGRVNVFLKDEPARRDQRGSEGRRNQSQRPHPDGFGDVYRSQAARARGGGKRKKMQEASRKMDALAKKLGKWDPQATIRKFRDTNLKGDS